MNRNMFLALVLVASTSAGDLGPQPHAIEIIVRPTEIDVKGHVNNAKYIEYLQWARWDWLDAKGLTNDRLAELGTVLVVARIEVDYRREAKQGETLKVETTVEKVGEKSFTVKQTVVKSGGEHAAEARVVMVAVDPSTHRSRPLPDELRKALTIQEASP